MTETAFQTLTTLLRAQASIVERLSGGLASVHGVGINEAMLLLHLARAPLGRLTRVELARRLYVNASTVTRMAAPMEKIGLVTRQSDPRDARLAYVALSQAGARQAAEIRETLVQRADGFFRDRWQADEVRVLGELLGRLIVNEPGEPL